jgi:hypothetical protein
MKNHNVGTGTGTEEWLAPLRLRFTAKERASCLLKRRLTGLLPARMCWRGEEDLHRELTLHSPVVQRVEWSLS